MELTPNDVEQKAFTQALRGYQMDEVDDFLDEIVSSLRAVDQRLKDAQDKIRALESEALSKGGDETTISRAILVAQRSADALLEDAKGEADRIRQTAVAETESLSLERDRERTRLQGEIQSMGDRVSGLRQTLAVLAEAVADQVDKMETGLANATSALGVPLDLEDTTELSSVSPIREGIAAIFPAHPSEEAEGAGDEVDENADNVPSGQTPTDSSIDLDEGTGEGDDLDDEDLGKQEVGSRVSARPWERG